MESVQWGYTPRDALEIAVYEGFWGVVNSDEEMEISGSQAINFFKKSGIHDVGILMQIWGLCTSSSTMTMRQFYSALRYISMIQNGEVLLSKGNPTMLSFV